MKKLNPNPLMLNYFQLKEESATNAKDTKKKGYKQIMHSRQ
jgi:hypothetical protein